MKIKEQWKGKTLVSYDSVLGETRIEVDKIKQKDVLRIKRLGFGYIFEEETSLIEHKAVEQPIKKNRKRRTTNGKA